MKSPAALFPLLFLTGCFTGVESTPKITYKEVKRQNAGDSSPEEALASQFHPLPFSQWQPGNMFYVTDDRISLVLADMARDGKYPLQGDTVVYRGATDVTALTGDQVAEFTFTDLSGNRTYTYRAGADTAALAGRAAVEIPFTIPLEMVNRVGEQLKGSEYYVKTPLWFTLDDRSEHGKKFVKVTIDDILPANAIYPFKVVFSDSNGAKHCVFMSAGSGSRWTPREFPALFDSQDPRRNYPQISDSNWQKIIDSRIAPGMTKTEVTLALGSPAAIDRGANQSSAYERWRYADGVSVVFEDGLVVTGF
ncbi:MAG: outer membrane protein assembly factor BamE [Muribaculaceae bacterium]|nr:outer membrane protein assembly factor BamE [Muribaculaceae bacterium]